MSLSFKQSVTKLSDLEKYVDYVKNLSKMQNDSKFQLYIQKKCLETVNKVSQERLYTFTTTNEDMREQYLANNKIRNVDNGFIIYNDSYVTTDNPSYADGKFSIALAFEYGVGIIGEQNPKLGAWSYDVNGNLVFDEQTGEHIRGWWIPKEKNGNNPYVKESKNGNAVVTQGYEGMEIYRYSAEEIRKQLPLWVKEYMKKKEV